MHLLITTTLFILVTFFALPISRVSADTIDSSHLPLIPEDALSEVLMGIKLTPVDLSFRTDYIDLDSFRLPIVDSLTEHPLEMVSFADEISARLFGDMERSLAWLLRFEHGASGLLADTPYRESSVPVLSGRMPELDKRLADAIEAVSGDNECIADHIRAELSDHIKLIRQVTQRGKMGVDSLFGILSPQELAFIRHTFPELLLEDVEDEFRSVEELDSIQKVEEGFTRQFIPMAERLVSDRQRWTALKELSARYDVSMLRISEVLVNKLVDSCACESDAFQFEIPIAEGKIAIGGSGRNHYAGRYVYILDLGGDDRYDLEQVDASQYIIDLTGNDQYSALTDFALASGFLYPAFLIDEEGDDTYSGKNFSVGSGLFSLGVLVDKAGNDRYFGDTHTQGAGSFGIGLLVDKSGSDVYSCALFGQAFAYVRALGVLCDVNGNDIYFAGGKYKDVLRYKDHFLSLSQGFAYGHRPWMSGGVAILADSSGHDTYISDIFGQGSSYWCALGIQTDFQGNDKYLSFQYAQGAGTHLTLGLLMDKTGDDYYFSKGVSQGCGHDLAAGFLVDYSGNDTYQAYDLSQGAGSANGLGWLIDYSGDDSYQIKGRHNSQGYGNPRRDYGSIGLLMDLMGVDEYIGNGADSSIWIIDSKWGIGVDFDFWESDSAGVIDE